MNQKIFSEEFKIKAVRLIVERGHARISCAARRVPGIGSTAVVVATSS
jgi:transposase-like protein